jgi:hypothetical protein
MMNDTTIDNDNATKLVQIIKSRITSRDDFRIGNKVLSDQEEIKKRLQHAAQSKPYQLLTEVAKMLHFFIVRTQSVAFGSPENTKRRIAVYRKSMPRYIQVVRGLVC